MDHINVHGPRASGKTRSAQALARHFGCRDILDVAGRVDETVRLSKGDPRTLVLTHDPVRLPGVRNVHIDEAKRLAGIA